MPQYPNKTFKAAVATTSSAINTNARTLLVELHADNPDGELQPGAYAQVDFELPSDPNIVRIPTSALVFRERGMEVATIGPDDTIELKPITLGRNLGTEVEVVQRPDALGPASQQPAGFARNRRQGACRRRRRGAGAEGAARNIAADRTPPRHRVVRSRIERLPLLACQVKMHIRPRRNNVLSSPGPYFPLPTFQPLRDVDAGLRRRTKCDDLSARLNSKPPGRYRRREQQQS